MHDVIVVGAGIAGIAAAHSLRKAGFSTLLLEKSRGVGGRMATRRVAGTTGTVIVDHGAQYFTSRSQAFAAVIEPLIAAKTVEIWIEAVPTLKPDGTIEPPSEKHRYPRYACAEGMTAVCKALAVGLDLRFETKALSVQRQAGRWQIRADTPAGEQHFEGQALLVTTPPAQGFALLGSWGEQAALAPARQVHFDPCLAVMAGYDGEPDLGMPAGLRWEEDPLIAWSAVDGTKRHRSSGTTLVVHSTPEFAELKGELPREEAGRLLLAHCAQRLKTWARIDLAAPAWMQVHFWRYAMPTNPLAEKFLGVQEPGPLILAGCWCAGARVEGAFLSGLAAGEAMSRWLG